MCVSVFNITTLSDAGATDYRWMIELAYSYLQTHGRLTNRYLLARDGLNVKRSSFVCALLAKLPGIDAAVDPDDGIVLEAKAPLG